MLQWRRVYSKDGPGGSKFARAHAVRRRRRFQCRCVFNNSGTGGAVLKAPHATRTVRCPAAAALPVVRCVAQSTQTMVARSLDTLKQLAAKVSADTRQRLSDQLGDVDGALDSIETQLTDASSIKALASSTMTDDLQQLSVDGFVGGDVTELTSVASATAEKLREASQIDSVIEETSLAIEHGRRGDHSHG